VRESRTKEQALKPVEARTLRDEAVERLQAAIRNGTLPPGARLIERELAEQLGMSRIPIREAISRLVDEGLVRKLPHRGAVVYTPTPAEIEEISSLRVVLEQFSAERVVERWQDDHEAELREIVTAMRAAGAQRDFQQVYALDYQFHYRLWTIAEHSLMLEVLAGLRARISRFLYEATSALTDVELDIHINSHDALIELFKAGEVAPARAEITHHVLSAKTRILTYCQLASNHTKR
jgi:DNA-binding GntR family transcriptional regulator